MKALFAWLEAALAAIDPTKVVIPKDEDDRACGEDEKVVGTLTDEEMQIVGVLQSINGAIAEAQEKHKELHASEGYDGSACEEHHRLMDELKMKGSFVKDAMYIGIAHRLNYPQSGGMRILPDRSIVMQQPESPFGMLRSLIELMP
jgi:hypothetical protein